MISNERLKELDRELDTLSESKQNDHGSGLIWLIITALGGMLAGWVAICAALFSALRAFLAGP